MQAVVAGGVAWVLQVEFATELAMPLVVDKMMECGEVAAAPARLPKKRLPWADKIFFRSL